MTRLFLLFYLGVVLILISAWAIQGYVFRTRSAEENLDVVRRALFGGYRVARDDFSATPHKAKALKNLRSKFDYPVHIVDFDVEQLSEQTKAGFLAGEPYLRDRFVFVDAPGTTRSLRFGPLPQFVGPSRTEQLLGYAAVFALAALGIAILLRPVASQLRAIETAATTIASGDLSARIEPRRWRYSAPIERAFNAMADRTETLVQSQNELLQAVSHELRTPLARIRFATELIETAPTSEEKRKRLNAVDDATQELEDLVAELLTYVRMESPASDGSSQQVALDDVIEQSVEVHAGLHPEIRFKVDDPANPICIEGDQRSLSRAVGNLLNNAGRFAKENVRISSHVANGEVAIVIDDDGPGVSDDDQVRVFEPFVRLENNEGKGTGLGLAIVQRIAHAHGGRTEVQNNPSGGAQFRLILPASRTS